MPLTAKGNEIMKNMVSEYGPERGKRIFYASKNAHKITGVDRAKRPSRRRFRDALRHGASLDAAFGYAYAEEANRAGQGHPLDDRLVKQCIRDSVKEGGSVHDALKRAVDRRIQFLGSRDSFGGRIGNGVAGIGRTPDGVGGAIEAGLEGVGKAAEAAESSVEGARAMRHPQGIDSAARVRRARDARVLGGVPRVVEGAHPDHECSPANCYPGCGHLCMEGRDVIGGLMRRRGMMRSATTDLPQLFKSQRKSYGADECPPGEGEVGTPSYRWESSSNKTADRRRVRDELFAAQPSGKTERLLLGDARVNKVKGRRLGNLRKPMQRDAIGKSGRAAAKAQDQLMSSTRAMQRGEVEDTAGAFEHVERSVAAKGAHDPKALAAWIGRRAEGKAKFQKKAAAGRRRAARSHDDELPTVTTPSSASGPQTITMPSSTSSTPSSSSSTSTSTTPSNALSSIYNKAGEDLATTLSGAI